MNILKLDCNIVKGKKIILLPFGIITFFSFWLICMPDSTLYSGNVALLRTILIYLILFLFPLVVMHTKGVIDKKNIPICFIPFIYWAVTSFHIYQGAYPLNITGVIISSYFLLINSSYHASLYVMIKRFLLLLSICGIASYLLYLIGLPPFKRVEYYGEQLGGHYYSYWVSVLYVKDGTARLCSLFNEPGYFGTIIAILLCIERIQLKK